MEKIFGNTYIAEQGIHALACLFVARSLQVFFSFYSKLKGGFLAFKDFVECPSFYEGEITDTSGFENTILQINKLHNK